MTIRLRWNGNNAAQAEADAAFNRSRSKRRRKAKAKAARKARRKKGVGKLKPWMHADGKPDYVAYINSADWRRKRDGLFNRRGRKCEVCGTKYDLQVHHKHYRTLGRESDGDLTILCVGCHQNEHEGKGNVIMDPMTAEYLAMFRG